MCMSVPYEVVHYEENRVALFTLSNSHQGSTCITLSRDKPSCGYTVKCVNKQANGVKHGFRLVDIMSRHLVQRNH